MVGSITDLPVKESYLTLPEEIFSMFFLVEQPLLTDNGEPFLRWIFSSL